MKEASRHQVLEMSCRRLLRREMRAWQAQLQTLGQTRLDGEQQEILMGLQSLSRHVERVVKRALNYKTPCVTKTSSSFDLEQSCRRLLKDLKCQAEGAGLYLRIQFDPTMDRTYQGDEEELKMILESLVERALEHTTSGGVDVAVRGIDTSSGHLVEFRVLDSGGGLNDAQQDCIFEALGRLQDNSDVPEGLSLSLMRERCRSAGGDLGVESKAGVGSCFWFKWPLRLAEDLKTKEEDILDFEEAAQQQVFIWGGGAHQYRSLSKKLEFLGYQCDRLSEGMSMQWGSTEMEGLLPPLIAIFLLKRSGEAEDEVLERIFAASPKMRGMVIVDEGVRGDAEAYRNLGASAYVVQSLPPEPLGKMLGLMTDWEKGDPILTRRDV